MNIYLVAVLAILVGEYLLDTVSDLLNAGHIRAELPREFEGCYDADKYARSQEYLRDNTRLDIICASVVTPLTIAFILLGGFGLLDRWARGLGMGQIGTGLAFAGSAVFISQLCRIPFSVYRTFVIEERFGFNRTSPATFVTDILKKWALGALIGGALFAALVWIFSTGGGAAWLICWGLMTVVQLFLVFIAPVVLLPLFNKFTPLEEGDLRTAIEEFAAAQGFRLAGIFSIDASRRSSKSNAYFTGFGRYRRIALFDTLIEKHTVPELVSVLAHEIGHYRRKHVLVNMAVMAGSTGLMLFILSLFITNRGLFDAFGVRRTSVYASIVFFGFLYAPIQMMISLLGNIISRRHEYSADAFTAAACGKHDSMISALKKLSVDNLANLTPHPMKVFLSYSHPPVIERIRALARARGRRSGRG